MLLQKTKTTSFYIVDRNINLFGFWGNIMFAHPEQTSTRPIHEI